MFPSRLALSLMVLVVASASPGCIGGGVDHVKVIYAGSWSGSIGSESGSRSVEGVGDQVLDVSGSIVSAVIQKHDGGGGKLTVQLLNGNKVVKEESTSAQYGAVSVAK